MSAQPIHETEVTFSHSLVEGEVVPLVRPEEALTPEEFELAMRIASALGHHSIDAMKARAEFELYEAEQNGASELVLSGLRHNVRMWRTVQIDNIDLPR